MSRKLSKAERQLVIQHVLAHAGRNLGNDEIIKVTGTKSGKLKGDLFSLRSDLSTNVEMIEEDGFYTHRYTGTIEFLDPLADDIELDWASIGMEAPLGDQGKQKPVKTKSMTSEGNKVSSSAKKVVASEKEEEQIEIPDEFDRNLRSSIAQVLIESSKRLTVNKISEKIDVECELVSDELSAMLKDKVIESEYLEGFGEDIYGSTKLTKNCLIEEKAEVSTKKQTTEKVAEPVKTKITESIKDDILSILFKNAESGAKGKNGLIKAVHDEVKSNKIPKHDVEDLIVSLIDDGTLVEHGKDGRGVKYISAEYLESQKSSSVQKEDIKTPEASTASEAEEKPTISSKDSLPMSEDVVTEKIVGDFDIKALISDLEKNMTEEKEVLGPDVVRVLTCLASRYEKLEAENMKWRKMATLFVSSIKDLEN